MFFRVLMDDTHFVIFIAKNVQKQDVMLIKNPKVSKGFKNCEGNFQNSRKNTKLKCRDFTPPEKPSDVVLWFSCVLVSNQTIMAFRGRLFSEDFSPPWEFSWLPSASTTYRPFASHTESCLEGAHPLSTRHHWPS